MLARNANRVCRKGTVSGISYWTREGQPNYVVVSKVWNCILTEDPVRSTLFHQTSVSKNL